MGWANDILPKELTMPPKRTAKKQRKTVRMELLAKAQGNVQIYREIKKDGTGSRMFIEFDLEDDKTFDK